MQDGFKWSVTGGIIGILLVIISAMIISRIKDLNIEWLVGILIPIAFALIVWYVKFSSRVKEEDIEKIYKDINLKADKKEIISLEKIVKEHKEADKINYDILFEFVTSVDHKLDILINKN